MSLSCVCQPCAATFRPDCTRSVFVDLRHRLHRCKYASMQTCCSPSIECSACCAHTGHSNSTGPCFSDFTSRHSLGNSNDQESIADAAYASRDKTMEEEDDGALPTMESALPFDRQAKQLYPVSITWQPPFTMLLDLKGHGDLQACLCSACTSPCRSDQNLKSGSLQ